MTTALEDTINTIIPVGAANVNLEDLRDDVLLPMATGAQWIAEVVSLLNAANVSAARDALDLGTSDSPTFTGLTLTDLTVDTSVLKVIGSSNRVGVGTATPSVAFDVAVESQFTSTVLLTGVTTATNTLQLTGSGKIIVGATTTPTVNGLSAAETLAIAGTGNGASASISRYSNDANGARLTLFHGRGSVGSTTAAQDGDELGSIRWGGASGSSTPGEGAYIRAVVSGTPGTSAMPAALDFATTAAGANTATLRARLTPSGQLLFGHTSSIAVGGIDPTVQFHSTAAGQVGISMSMWTNDTVGPLYRFQKSRGTSPGSYTVVGSTDILGTMQWYGADGTGLVAAAQIFAQVDGTPGTNDMPTKLVFAVSADGSATPANRMIISNDGSVAFPAIATTASAANAFIDNTSSPANKLLRATSSLRYKHTIVDVSNEEMDKVLDFRPITYKSRSSADDPDKIWYGFIAEEMNETEPRLVNMGRGDDGLLVPDGVQYDRVVVLLTAKVKQLETRLAALEAA